MALSIIDLEDAILAGRLRAQKLHAEAQARMQEPMRSAQIQAVFKGLPPNVLAMLEQRNPEAMQVIRKEFLNESE